MYSIVIYTVYSRVDRSHCGGEHGVQVQKRNRMRYLPCVPNVMQIAMIETR